MAFDAAAIMPTGAVYFYRTRNGWIRIGHSADEEKDL
jgi:hypothetical protein